MSKNPHWVASASILLASLIWGASFPVLRYLLEAGVQPLALIAARFAVGAAGLAVVLVLTRTRLDLRALVQGGVIGLVLAVGYWFQTDGIRFTTSSKAAFITGLFVLFTPLLSAMLGQPARGRHVAGALLAVVGLLLLVRQPGAPLGGWTRGDGENLVAAMVFAVQIVLIARFARATPPLALAFVQIAVVAVAAMAALAATGQPLRPPVHAPAGVWAALGFLGLAATALAFAIQCTMQARLGATEAAVLFSLEPVFATLLAVSGWAPGVHEHLAPIQWAGAAVLVGAALWAERGPALIGIGPRRAGPQT